MGVVLLYGCPWKRYSMTKLPGVRSRHWLCCVIITLRVCRLWWLKSMSIHSLWHTGRSAIIWNYHQLLSSAQDVGKMLNIKDLRIEANGVNDDYKYANERNINKSISAHMLRYSPRSAINYLFQTPNEQVRKETEVCLKHRFRGWCTRRVRKVQFDRTIVDSASSAQRSGSVKSSLLLRLRLAVIGRFMLVYQSNRLASHTSAV